MPIYSTHTWSSSITLISWCKHHVVPFTTTCSRYSGPNSAILCKLFSTLRPYKEKPRPGWYERALPALKSWTLNSTPCQAVSIYFTLLLHIPPWWAGLFLHFRVYSPSLTCPIQTSRGRSGFKSRSNSKACSNKSLFQTGLKHKCQQERCKQGWGGRLWLQ